MKATCAVGETPNEANLATCKANKPTIARYQIISS